MKTDEKITERILFKMKACYPMVYCETKEEVRILRILKNVAQKLELPMYIWSATRGAIRQDGKQIGDVQDPMDYFDFIRKTSGLHVMLDPDPYFEDALFVRKVKDSAVFLTSSQKRLILVGQNANSVSIVSNLIDIIRLPLPSKPELREVITDIIREVDEEIINTASEALSGLTTDEAANLVAESIVKFKTVDPPFIMKEKCSKLSTREYLKVHDAIDLREIGGLENLVGWLQRRKNVFSQEAREFGLPLPKGILIVGVPGCGKSLTAKASASILGIPLIRFDVGAVMGSLVGESEKNIRDAISIAESMAPCVLWIDELDKQLSNSANGEAHETTKRVMSSLLTWLQEGNNYVFTIATANNISGLIQSFPELLRKGRWDEIFYVDLPADREREEIIKIHLSKYRDCKNFNIDKLVELTDGFTGAEIEACIKEAMYLAFHEGKDLEIEHIIQAFDRCSPQFADGSYRNSIMKYLKDIAIPASTEKTEQIDLTYSRR